MGLKSSKSDNAINSKATQGHHDAKKMRKKSYGFSFRGSKRNSNRKEIYRPTDHHIQTYIDVSQTRQIEDPCHDVNLIKNSHGRADSRNLYEIIPATQKNENVRPAPENGHLSFPYIRNNVGIQSGRRKRRHREPHPTIHDIFQTPSKTTQFDLVDISQDLLKRLHRSPEITSIPFFISARSRNSTSSFSVNDVRLPFSIALDTSSQQQRDDINLWPVIKSGLGAVPKYCQQGHVAVDIIFSVVSSYCPDALEKSNFLMLKRPDIAPILLNSLPLISEMALKLPYLIQEPIPILQTGNSKTIYTTRQLCCSLLANAFLCAFPSHRIPSMPDFNFFRLFNDTRTDRCEVKTEKLKCILNYFSQMHAAKQNSKFQNQIISFERRCMKGKVKWERQEKLLCNVRVEHKRNIEQASNHLQVDFANKIIGGGVLNDGSVMEEIRFCISPELIVSRLFTQTLADDEVMVITGTEIFSECAGYSTSFRYKGPRVIDCGNQPVDTLGRTYTQIVAMDALSFKRNESWKQFQKRHIDRELNKCRVAFKLGRAAPTPIATGNWGCGAFNGDPELKFLIQCMASSRQSRPLMQYHTMGNLEQGQKLTDISAFIIERDINIGRLYQVITEYCNDERCANFPSIFSYVKYRFSG